MLSKKILLSLRQS
jgi:hypothetical protein